MDCEGVPDNLHLLQMATASGIYVIDCHVLGAEEVCQALREPLLESDRIIKLFHDIRCDAQAMDRHGFVSDLKGVVDTQLVVHSIWQDDDPFEESSNSGVGFSGHHSYILLASIGFNGMLERLDLPTHPLKHLIRELDGMDYDLWTRRPIPSNFLEYAALDVHLLYHAIAPLQHRLSPIRRLEHWVPESLDRAREAVTIYRLVP